MPCNKLIEKRIELRWRQPLDKLPRWPHFQHVGWAVYEWPFAIHDERGHRVIERLFEGCGSSFAMDTTRHQLILPEGIHRPAGRP